MSLTLTDAQRALADGPDDAAMAMRIVTEAARLLGAKRLIPVASAHIDGALYHGDSGTLFAERLVERGARVAIRATLNVGALDLTGCAAVRMAEPSRTMARRLMDAYRKLGCEPTWTCAPYQAGHRPAFGTDVAWGESNAVVFCNSVLGARTNRYGDFLDIACAITGLAPDTGLHRPENRRARFVFDLSGLPEAFLGEDHAWPVLGSLYGREAGSAVGVVDGLRSCRPGEDALKAFGAAAASTGAVGLFHMAGVTPEAPDARAALDRREPDTVIRVTPEMVRDARLRLSTAAGATVIDAVAIGSPHLSLAEFDRLEALLGDRRLAVPLYACTGRHVLTRLDAEGRRSRLERLGVTVVADTCVVVTPILPAGGSVLMTNSGKFAQYAPGNTGHAVIYGSLADCVESAVAGRPVQAETIA